MTDEWLTANQAGAELGVTGETIKVWARDREITGWQTPGGHWRFKRLDVEAFLAKRAS